MHFFKPLFLAAPNRLNFGRKTLFSLFFLVAPLYFFGQGFTPDPDWRFETFNGQNHFISNEINNVVIDRNGYIWTSSSGIQRFDGYKTANFNSFEQGNQGLKSNSTDVIADNAGRIWVNSAGLCYYDDEESRFIYVNPDPKRPINGLDYMIIKGNNMWYVGDYGLTEIDLKSLKTKYTSLKTVGNPLGNFFIDDSTLLVSSREKVYIYNIKRNTYVAKTFLYNHSLLKIFAVEKSGAAIFLGTNHGLFTLNNLNTLSLVSSGAGEVDDLLFMPQDKEKKYLFAATNGNGILVYNTSDEKMAYRYVHDDNNPYSLPNNVVSKMYADKAGRLWLATGEGVSMLDIRNQQWKMRLVDKANISKITVDRYDTAKVWISSYTQGMMCINWKTKQVERVFNADPQMSDVCDFVQLSKNKWLLAAPRKIMEWDMQSGAITPKKMPVSDSINLVYNISNLVVAENNTCFITTTFGLFKYDMVTHRIDPVATLNNAKRGADPLQYILLSGFYDRGILWAASRNGLFSYNEATNQTIIYRGQGAPSDYFFFDICLAPGHRVLCPSSSGLTIFNQDVKKFTIVKSLANLSRPICISARSVNNDAWIGTEDGILTYNLDTRQSARAEQENQRMQRSPGSPFFVINHQIVRGYPSGYIYFTPDRRKTFMPSDPVIESVSVNNQPIPAAGSHPGLQKARFNHTENSINIAFTAFLYNDPNYINFRYKLKGGDAGWHYPEDQRTANFAQLEPGDYTFYVQSGNKNGIWNKNMASFSFIIQPPYWATWWFRVLVAVLIAFVLYRFYLYRIKNILAIQRIREKIASDFHDDIGSALSSISIFSDVANKQLQQELPREKTREIVDRISYHSHAMLDAMDDIVWAVNPKNDNFKNLAVRMNEFAIPLLEAKNIQFDINIMPDMLNSRIKMESRKNLFLIFKECVNNSVKHSGCTAMTVTVQRSNNQVELSISDNGKGFDPDTPTSRNGVKNMQKRAAEINGLLQINTSPGKGTTTTLSVNII